MVSSGRRYRILECLGSGGFGAVYRAELLGEGGFSKFVALKTLHKEMAEVEEVARRFRDEARILGLVRHRAIVQVHEVVELAGRRTVVMEYVEGADLAQLIEAGPIPVGPALAVVEEVAGALHAAYNGKGREGHQLRLLHRDLKPSNIRLTPHGEVKILDFGIARADFVGREAETRSLLFGSLPYLSPERMDLRNGPESDVYALGAVLYECLVGEALGRTSATLPRHEAHLGRAIDRLRGRLPDYEGVVDFVAELLAYEPEARPTAREVERRCHRLLRLPSPLLGRLPLWRPNRSPRSRPRPSGSKALHGA